LCSYQLWARPQSDSKGYLLCDHLSRVSENSARILSDFLSRSDFDLDHDELLEAERLIGGSHDVAKASSYFQAYIKMQGQVDRELKAHSPLSSVYVHFAINRVLEKNNLPLDSFGAMCVMGHHSRLFSPVELGAKLYEWKPKLEMQVNAIDAKAREELNKILNKMKMPDFELFRSEWKNELSKMMRKLPVTGASMNGLSGFYMLNVLYSALLDADRLDAAGIPIPPVTQSVNSKIVKEYIERLVELSKEKASPEILSLRKALFEGLKSSVETMSPDRRIYSITAPTGSGKTLSGIYLALRLRERLMSLGKNVSRIIYVAPFLSIIDQNFEVLEKALGTKGQSNVLLKHDHLSELSYKNVDIASETYSTFESELLIEGWNAEIVVTTFVQFLYTILGNSVSQLRKLHNLAGSIVILDEVQSIPHRWWPLISEALKFISHRMQTFFILMTATQPLIFGEDEIVELVPENDIFDKTFCKINYSIDEHLDLESFKEYIIDFINQHRKKSVMVLLNTIDSATYVVDGLIDAGIDPEYLSAEVVPADRISRIKGIKEKLDARKPVVLVTTQVVEAGVDLDFNYVIRDMAPLDSIIQAAGRCNRRGKESVENSIVSIMEIDRNHSPSKLVYGEFLIDKSKEAIQSGEKIIRELAKIYYQKIREGMSEASSNDVLKGICKLDYSSLENFKVIDDAGSVQVFIETDDESQRIWKEYELISNEKISWLEKRERFLKIRHRFFNYVINVNYRYTMNIPESQGMYHIGKDQVEKFYNRLTGFKRQRQT
jgi:CRISPR-associated endonuclease/helicase Cas3